MGLATRDLADEEPSLFDNVPHAAPLIFLRRVVKDDPERVPHPRTDAAHAMAQIHAVIVTLRTPDGPLLHSERCRVALPQGHDFDAALHPRPLLGQDELAAGEVLA